MMKLYVDEKGLLRFSGNITAEMEVVAGKAIIGRLTTENPDFPLHSLVQHLQQAIEFGVTAKAIDDKSSVPVDIDCFVNAYVHSGLLSNLQRLIRGGKWVVYSMHVRKSGQVEVVVGIVLPLSLRGRRFSIRCQGMLPKEAEYSNEKHFSNSHWFMPDDCVLGLRCVYEVNTITKFLEFSVEFHDGHELQETLSYRAIPSLTEVEMLKYVPPLNRIHRTCSINANQSSFLNGGRAAYVRLIKIAEKYGVSIASEELRVLEWGVGCGRVIKHFEELPTRNLWGIDIDADNVQYCNETLRSKSITVRPHPPTEFEDASFDFIYSCSVLSHLTETSINEWLAEINRLLSEKGVALLSFNGSSNCASYLSRRPNEAQGILDKGFFDGDINHELDGYIPGREYYRATFATDLWWRRKFEKYFCLCGVEYGVVNGHQDIAVVKRRYF